MESKNNTQRKLRIAFDFVDANDEPCDGNLSFLNTFTVSLTKLSVQQRITFTSILEKEIVKTIDRLAQMEEINHPIVLSPAIASKKQDDSTCDKLPKLAYKYVRYGSKIETRKSSYHDDILRHVEQ